MDRLLILDSNSLLNRAFYAIPPLTTKDGLNTNAVYGFTNMLLKLKEEIKPDYIVAAFDRKAPTFRHEEYGDYKAGRKKMPPELAEQFPLIKDVLKLMAINVYEIDGFEADDIIGTLARVSESKGIEVYIVTGDKDALQLATDNIKVVITKKGVTETAVYNRENFEGEFGVTPTQFIDVKGLMGDKSDNIPGVPGVGEKTAFKLIQTYGSLEAVLSNIDEISGKKLKENLENFREQAIFSKKLATIMTEVPIEFDFNEIKSNESYDIEGLRKYFIKLQMNSMLNKLPESEVEMSNEPAEEVDFIKIESVEDLKGILEIKDVAYITYTLNESSLYSKLSLKELYINGDSKVYCIKIGEIISTAETDAFAILKAFMEDNNVEKVIHHSKKLITYLEKNNIHIAKFTFDTAIAAYLVDSSKSEYPIALLMGEYLGKEVKGDGDELNCKLVHGLREISNILKEKISEDKMEELYYEIEHPLISVLAHMESIGFKVNKDKLDELSLIFKAEIEKTEKTIYEQCEEEFNINSPKQLGRILFEKLDLPVIKKTKTGYSTNAEVLEKLSDKHEVISKIIYYRQITKLNSTYVEGLKNVIDEDGAIHSSFNQTVTTTGRLSSTEPNLQNIPIKYEMGREIRKVFIPKQADDILLSCDYSQIELRVLAHMSGDENMIEGFNNHSDIHTKTASEVFRVPIDEVTSLMRSRAKAVNFGIVYGISDFSLAQDLKITKKEASEYMEIYFDRYPNIKKYLDGVITEAKENGCVLTLLNRRRFIPEIKSSNKIVKALGERLAMNAPIQGTAADIIKIAMVKVFNKLQEKGLKSQIILQVHDELVINVKKDEFQVVVDLVKKEMEGVLKLSVPLEVDVNHGNTWYDVK